MFNSTESCRPARLNTSPKLANCVHVLISDFHQCIFSLAVGTLKYTSERVISHLLWAARFEQLPVLRAQVCHTLAILGNKDERIVTALKDLLNVEDNVMVLRYGHVVLGVLRYGHVVLGVLRYGHGSYYGTQGNGQSHTSIGSGL